MGGIQASVSLACSSCDAFAGSSASVTRVRTSSPVCSATALKTHAPPAQGGTVGQTQGHAIDVAQFDQLHGFNCGWRWPLPCQPCPVAAPRASSATSTPVSRVGREPEPNASSVTGASLPPGALAILDHAQMVLVIRHHIQPPLEPTTIKFGPDPESSKSGSWRHRCAHRQHRYHETWRSSGSDNGQGC